MVILSGGRLPVLVHVLVQLLVAALVVEDSMLLGSRARRGRGTLPALCSVDTHCNMFLLVCKQDLETGSWLTIQIKSKIKRISPRILKLVSLSDKAALPWQVFDK